MSRIEESSRKISDIIGVIDEIAHQTNLLALNAAVEAARAGEAGSGFAVVASEVRSLAQRSSQAAKDIKDLINNSNSQVREGVDLVNRAGSSLEEIVASIKRVATIVADIAAASNEQATGLDQITRALSQLDEVTQQNSALVEENAATAKTLEQQSSDMGERVDFFRLDGIADTAPARSAA
jgi:methyl-accepting chemotaxis protein